LPEVDRRAVPGCEVPAGDGVPTCATGPAGRFAFVIQELMEILRELRQGRQAQ